MDAQRLQLRLQEAVNNMVEDLQKTKIRSLQKNAFLAMAECYSDTRASQQQIDQCISVQEQLMQAVHQTIGNEMNSFQNRLQRCSMACQDDVKDKFGDLQEGDSRISGAEAMMVGCAGKCVDTHVAMLPSLKKNVLSKIEDIERQIPR